jgi:hypothetical protein
MIIAACFLACGFIGCEDEVVAPPAPDTLALPSVVIQKPALTPLEPQYAQVVHFVWGAGEGAEPVAVRHLWSPVVDTTGTYNPSFDIIKDLNKTPSRYEAWWSRWIPLDAPGDSGTGTIIGDDETLELGRSYLFAVQARDEDGRRTDSFSVKTNARRFGVSASAIPLLLIYDEYLVGFRFIGTNLRPEERAIPPGIPLRIRWRADVSAYGGEVAGYRYAWDLPDIAAWDAPFKLGCSEAEEVTFYGGVHTLFVETVDIAGAHTLARVTLNVIPFPMDRNLLFVDAYYASTLPVPDYSSPSESVHDAFWLKICSYAAGFDPARDVYDCSLSSTPPDPSLIGRYKNIIVTHSSSNAAWAKMVTFTPESEIGRTSRPPLNYLSMFLLRGGHVWTLGQSQRNGGLAAALLQRARSFPMSLECEITGNRDDCDGDRSGVYSMPYRDYCVSVLDKVDGTTRGGSKMPVRIRDHYDCMSHALRDDSDPLTAAHPGLPERLDLWEEVVKSGRYFNPDDSLGPGGFTYVEVYNPGYWMTLSGIFPQPCFHPMYRMRARSDQSALNGGTIAIWVAKYEDVVPEVSSGIAVAAPSFHFGVPLWFFKRSSVDSIATVVFDEWGILK